MEYRKLPTETEILAQLKRGDWGLPPLTVESLEVLAGSGDKMVDAVICLGWRGRIYRFGVEVRRLWTPKAVAEAADQIQRNVAGQQLLPLVIVPYLSEERLRELEAREISGIDLCGNGVVLVPGELLVLRSSFPNRYRWEGRIKNIYRGTSGLVARAFLLVGEFLSLGEVLDHIRAFGGEVTLSTVSKVCKSLEQDLVIERTQGKTPRSCRLRLLQPEKLLDLLRRNYTSPSITATFTGKFAASPEVLLQRLLDWQTTGEGKVVLTGASSVDAYAVMARQSVRTFYCTDVTGLKESLGGDLKETERFANVRFLETSDEFVYFDRRPRLVASPVQTYLELVAGEKRDKETAKQVRRVILSQLPAEEGTR